MEKTYREIVKTAATPGFVGCAVMSASIEAQNSNPSKSDTNYKVGLGLPYHFTKSLGMRAEAERYRINDAVGNKGDIDLLSIGLVYRFGGASE